MKKLGQLLVDQGLVTPFHVDRAIWWQQDDGGRLGGLLIRLGYLDESGFLRVMEPLVHARGIQIDDDAIDPRAAGRIPSTLARRTSAVAIGMRNDRLVVAMTDPGNLTSVSDLEAVTGMRVESCLAADPAVARVLDKYYPIETTLPALAPRPAMPTAVLTEATRDTGHTLDNLLFAWIRDALIAGASHLVIERAPLFLVVRCEMPTDSFELTQLEVMFQRPLIRRLRLAAGLPTPNMPGWRQEAPIRLPYRGTELSVELTLFPDTLGPTARLALGDARARLCAAGLMLPAATNAA